MRPLQHLVHFLLSICAMKITIAFALLLTSVAIEYWTHHSIGFRALFNISIFLLFHPCGQIMQQETYSPQDYRTMQIVFLCSIAHCVFTYVLLSTFSTCSFLVCMQYPIASFALQCLGVLALFIAFPLARKTDYLYMMVYCGCGFVLGLSLLTAACAYVHRAELTREEAQFMNATLQLTMKPL